MWPRRTNANEVSADLQEATIARPIWCGVSNKPKTSQGDQMRTAAGGFLSWWLRDPSALGPERALRNTPCHREPHLEVHIPEGLYRLVFSTHQKKVPPGGPNGATSSQNPGKPIAFTTLLTGMRLNPIQARSLNHIFFGFRRIDAQIFIGRPAFSRGLSRIFWRRNTRLIRVYIFPAPPVFPKKRFIENGHARLISDGAGGGNRWGPFWLGHRGTLCPRYNRPVTRCRSRCDPGWMTGAAKELATHIKA